MTIRVNNLPPQITEANLIQLFLEYSSVETIEIFENENAASITLSGEPEEDAAINALNGTEWRGNILKLELEPKSRDAGGPPTGGSGGGSSGGRSPEDAGDPPKEGGGKAGSRDVGGPPR
jgi:RNA recognition motif-containing protein